MCNSHGGLNPIKVADPIITPFNYSMIYGIPEESNNAETCHLRKITRLRCQKRNKRLMWNPWHMRELIARVQLRRLIKKPPHMPTMVSTHAKCVLPSWTHRYKLSIQTLKQSIPKITRKKRELLISRDYVELTPKRLQISHNVDEAPIILAAADH